jgi:hypothetical protein
VSHWQIIFLQCKANRGEYNGDTLPPQNWKWPEGTWFQKRLCYRRGSHLLLLYDPPTIIGVAPKHSPNEAPTT